MFNKLLRPVLFCAAMLTLSACYVDVPGRWGGVESGYGYEGYGYRGAPSYAYPRVGVYAAPAYAYRHNYPVYRGSRGPRGWGGGGFRSHGWGGHAHRGYRRG
jgi:hypothetical protein